MNRDDEAEAKVVEQLLESYRRLKVDLLEQVNEVPGEERRSRILTFFYYVAEANLCVDTAQRGYPFIPARFLRSGSENSLLATMNHQEFLPGIYQTKSLLQRLFLKHYQLQDNETLAQIDSVLGRFFEITGYPIIHDLKVLCSRSVENDG